MKYGFAALSFPADENLAGRHYWYMSPFPVSEGENVLAPVGPHDRLQSALVEKVLFAEAEDAPYDVRLIKKIAAKYGVRRVGKEEKFLEFGGVRYDAKHYTRFRRLLLVRESFLAGEAEELGVTLCFSGREGAAFYERLADERGATLVCGSEGEKIFRTLYAFLRGDKAALGAFGVTEETAAKLEEKLG